MNNTDPNDILSRIRWDLSGEAIERESFRIIETETDLPARLPLPEWRVARRLIHTTADLRIADTLRFINAPVTSGLAALRNGAPIFCDSKMIRAGLSLDRLQAPQSFLRKRSRPLPHQRSRRSRAGPPGRSDTGHLRRGKGAPHARRRNSAHRQRATRAGPHRPLHSGGRRPACPCRRHARWDSST